MMDDYTLKVRMSAMYFVVELQVDWYDEELDQNFIFLHKIDTREFRLNPGLEQLIWERNINWMFSMLENECLLKMT